MKAISTEALIALSEDDLRSLFPFGVKEGKKNRWTPAEEDKADWSLEELLKAKKDRQEKPRYLRSSYSKDNYTHVASQALGKDKHGHGAPEEAVPREDQERFSQEARRGFYTTRTGEDMTQMVAERYQLKVLLATYRKVAREKGVDIRSDIKVVERRIEALDRKLGVRAA